MHANNLSMTCAITGEQPVTDAGQGAGLLRSPSIFLWTSFPLAAISSQPLSLGSSASGPQVRRQRQTEEARQCNVNAVIKIAQFIRVGASVMAR
jgi:hypothetical protein